ncbi:cation:proton antiporter [Haloarcula nitratireducens]|uniref:Cation:proton antiporter n=1 Tax=Haloarcula nitratireducens TaxID=2487749 RepID=A0AAW4PAD5_9EURY|nr:cation:proton antiporter [Halomicroarcula nitratireducens]MBX0294917.1 cation:proton antiporter [Halomicroarcula nitratireducens]
MDPVVLAVETSPIESLLLELLPVFIIAAGVGIFVAKVGRFPYTIALLLAGFAISVIGADIDINLTHDLILLVLLPPLLFEGAATTDLERLRRNAQPVLAMAAVGLIISITLLGYVGQYVFGFPLLIALLFAAMALPTDPVSVLALFEELGAPERLSVLVEGESLVNDGIGVVIFSTFFVLIQEGANPAELFTAAGLTELGLQMVVSSVGGLLVGLAAGYAVYTVMAHLDENMTETVLAFILAYGSFLLAQHYLGVSGVIATVVSGLLIGNRGAEKAMAPQTKITVFNSLETASFVVNTFIFLMIGVVTPIGDFLQYGHHVLLAIPLVLAARAAAVYPLTALVNRVTEPAVPMNYQHVMLWGGLHGSIPIALVLGLPDGFPLRQQLLAMVFGVAAFSLVVQGLTMGPLLNRLGVVTRSDAEELYELLVGRARAVDAALEAAERLDAAGDIPTEVYRDFEAEYSREKEDLNDAIATLLHNHEELRHEQVLQGERRVLAEEKSAIMDATQQGVITDDIAESLLEETNLKLDRVRGGETTVQADREGYEEFWRSRADDFGLEIDETDGESESDEGAASPS